MKHTWKVNRMNDLISRQAAIDAIKELCEHYTPTKRVTHHPHMDFVIEELKALPSAQPDGIPLEWIDKHLEWLDNCDNDFAQLAKTSIKAMVEIWKKDRI